MTLSRRALLAALASPALATILPGHKTVHAAETPASPVTHPHPVRLGNDPLFDAIAEISEDRYAELDSLLVEATSDQIRGALALGRLTSRELVLSVVRRISLYDGWLNAVITLNPDLLIIADRLDAERANRQTRGPLHGIPILLKDNIGTGDLMMNTAGAGALADLCSDRDSFLVRRLRKAGLIVLGKTNLTEWAGWLASGAPHGYSALGGQTANPYGDWLSPLGSSSGSAVGVAASYTPFAIGTETLGSIIAPAAVNSVVGIHPSIGLISRDRVIPLFDQMDTPGPMTRTVGDAAALLTVLSSSRDQTDSLSAAARPLIGTDFSRALRHDAVRGKRIGLVPSYWYASDTIDAVLQPLIDAGAEIEPLDILGYDIEPIWELVAPGFRFGVEAYLQAIESPTVRTIADIVAFNDSDPDRFAPFGEDLLLASLESTLDPDTLRTEMDTLRTGARAYIDEMMTSRNVDLIVSVNNEFSGEYSIAGYPAITVPAGYDASSDEPFGLTFVGQFLTDETVIGAAYAYEHITQARRPPVLT